MIGSYHVAVYFMIVKMFIKESKSPKGKIILERLPIFNYKTIADSFI